MSGNNPTTYLEIAYRQELIQLIRRNIDEDEAITKIAIAELDDTLVPRLNGTQTDSDVVFSDFSGSE